MSFGAASRPRIACLLGKPLRPDALLTEVVDRLRAASAVVTIHLPAGDAPLPSWVLDADLVIQRGLGLPELTAALAAERAGRRCCNRIAATINVKDRVMMASKLATAGVPHPTTIPAATWTEVVELAGGKPVVVKAADGGIGRGLGVVIAELGYLPATALFAGPYVVQEYVRGSALVYKVYVAGPWARGLTKRWPPPDSTAAVVSPIELDADLADLARRIGAALDLEIYNVDVLYGSDGPMVVDVNPFPGFRGIPHAAHSIADYLWTIVRREA